MRKAPLPYGFGRVLAGAFAAALGCTVGSTVGCSDTPQPVAPQPPSPPVAVEPPPPAIDLSPVAEPPGIFVTARWKNPDATLAGLHGCAGVPVDLPDTDPRSLLDRALANAFRGGVDGKQIADAVALDAPVDLVVAMEERRGAPSALFAFSVGLTSLERIKSTLSAAGPLEELQPNLWRVGVKEGPHDLSCAVGPAAGVAPARLVCGLRDKDLVVLGPYLARNLPVAAPPAQDLHAEVRFAPIDARYGPQIRSLLGLLPNYARMAGIGEPRYDTALSAAAGALADEGAALVSDLDRLTVDLGVDASSCLTAATTLELRSKTSWVAGLLAERGDRAGPPPAIFWRAPLDSESASYGHATDVARYDGILRTLRGLLEGKLAREQVGSEADRKALSALLALPVGKDTNAVFASGHFGAPSVSSGAPAGGPVDADQQVVDDIVHNYLGWYVLGLDEGPAAVSKLLKDIVSVYGRKALTDRLRKEMGRDAGLLPTAKLVPAPPALGKGALDLELRFQIPRPGDEEPSPAKGKPPKKKTPELAIHLLLMGEPQSTWLAVGANRDELVKRLVSTKTGAPETATLAARPGLEPLRSGKAFSSGFITLGMITHGIASALGSPSLLSRAGSQSGKIADLTNTLNHLPHRGETPIFVTSTAAAGTGPRGELTINMQKGSFEDAGAILLTGLRLFKRP